jgi:hypothetical protein
MKDFQTVRELVWMCHAMPEADDEPLRSSGSMTLTALMAPTDNRPLRFRRVLAVCARRKRRRDRDANIYRKSRLR